MVGFSWLGGFWCLVFSFMFSAQFHETPAAYASVVSCVLCLLTPAVLRWTGSPTVAGNYLLSVAFLTLAFFSWNFGGYKAPALTWCVLLPMVAIMVADNRSGVAWSCVVIALVIGLYFADLFGYRAPELLAPEDMRIVACVATIGLMVLIVLFTLLYETFKDRTLERLKMANLKLSEARDRALEASRAKSTFLANMSHELRTPLNAVIGYSDMLVEEGAIRPEDFQADLKRIRAAGKHLLRLVNDILDLSKSEAGKMELEIDDFGVKPLVEELVETMSQLAVKNENVIECDFGPSLGEMRSDATKVRQCLYNLLSNACKFTHAGKILVIVKRLDIEGREWFEFCVTDTGIGMTPEQRSRVFEPFVQADTTMARRYGGTGLGLSLTVRFCQLLGGTLAVESEKGKGSIFTLILPAEIDGAAEELLALPGEQDL
ncbi:MAG: HAMP domain-containing histidine kinase [Candidatus Eremiobacteraeota bacterium]|nr:HAMP domain-containing histidine kinase [Candidatus Eremiobacteraeota bacterium]